MRFQIVYHAFHVASAMWLLQSAGAQDFNFTLNATDSNSTMDGLEAACSANSACAGLADDCCPTMDGVFLCKFDQSAVYVGNRVLETHFQLFLALWQTVVSKANYPVA